jgi:peroxiredoxin Q/BCP
MAKLKVGDKAPTFSVLNQKGKKISSKDFAGKPYVIYFYPKASTPGCTTQSCELRDAMSDLKKLKASVIGVSADSVEKQKKFDDKYKFGFDLLADEEKDVINAYGVWGDKSLYGKKFKGIIRSAFVVDAKGKIAGVFYKISPKDTVPKTLEVLNNL